MLTSNNITASKLKTEGKIISHDTHAIMPKERCKRADLRCSLAMGGGGAEHLTELGFINHSSVWEAPVAQLTRAGFALLRTPAPGAPQQPAN